MNWDLISEEQVREELGVIHKVGGVDSEFMESFSKGEKRGEKKGPRDT